MLYRQLGKTGFEVSILGFGAMRLPVVGGNKTPMDGFDPRSVIDEEKTKSMIDYAVRHGINYFDTAYPYHTGKSEPVLGKYIKPYRDRVYLVTKLLPRFVETEADYDRLLDEQLKKLDTPYLDIYLVHGVNRPAWDKLKTLNITSFLDRIQKDGRARKVGFSFHDDVMLFKEVVDYYDWAVCQIQYNYYDENHQAGKTGLFYAASRGIGVVIMEPVRGGQLAEPIPAKVKTLWDTATVKRSAAAWALRWVWNHPEVSVVLSGMSNMDQLVENIRIADDGRANSLSDDELALINKVKNVYREAVRVNCTGCAYCMPCENGVAIPGIFSMYNDQYIFDDSNLASIRYSLMLSPNQQATSCTQCGKCEEKCPQHIEIRKELERAHASLYHPERVPTALR
ncbi:MAG TPA: aldo/keto reductase [Syntrophorhabdaceae bacterium]|nr:aldo/keto reductase [Syntrophorhabdaceae bacterium]